MNLNFVLLSLFLFLLGFPLVFSLNRKNSKISFLGIFLQSSILSVIYITISSFSFLALGIFNKKNVILSLMFFLLFGTVFLISSKFKKSKNLKIYFKREEIIIFAISLLFLLIMPPFEIVASLDDGHLYLNGGIAIAKEGSLIFKDDIDTELSSEAAELYNSGWNYIPKYKDDFRMPRTLHFIHTWVAFLYTLGGLNLAFCLNYVFCFLSTLLFYKILHSFLKNPINTLFPSFLFLTSYIQIWFTKYPNTEIPFQFLLLSLTYFFYRYSISNNNLDHFIYLMSLALMFMTRIDGIAIFLCFYLLLLFKNYFFNSKIFLVDILSPLLLGGLYLYLFGKDYIVSNFSAPDQPWLFVLIIFLFLSFLFPVFKKIIKLDLPKIKDKLVVFLNIFLMILLLYFLFFKPKPGFRLDNIKMILDYIMPPVFIFGWLGFFEATVSAVQKLKKNSIFWIFLFLFFPLTVLFLDGVRNRLMHPWVMRRYVITLLPLVMLGFGYFWELLNKTLTKKIIMLLSIFFLSYNIIFSLNIFPYIEMDNVFSQVENIFSDFDEKDRIIYLDASYPQLAFPVRFILNKGVIMGSWKKFNNTDINPVTDEQKQIFLNIIETWAEGSKNVYLVNPNEETIKLLDNFGYKSELIKEETILIKKHLNRVYGQYTDYKADIYEKINIFSIVKKNNENLLY